jgi:hypothetical protein
LKHLKNKIGLGKVKDILDWASDPDCWWYSKLTGFKMLYNKREMILKQMETKKEDEKTFNSFPRKTNVTIIDSPIGLERYN